MITEKEYLEAQKIVDAYKEQLRIADVMRSELMAEKQRKYKMTTSELFAKHFPNVYGGNGVGFLNPNVEAFFEELNQECLKEDVAKKVCSICEGYGVYNGCIKCGKVSDAFFGHD